MANKIITTQLKLVDELIKREFIPRSISVVDQKTIQDRIITRFARNCENYALMHMPENVHNGVADVQILYKLAGILFNAWLEDYPDNENYIPGTIAKQIEQTGLHFIQAVKTFSLVKTKAAINNAVDVVSSMSIDPMFISSALPNIDRDFVHLMLTDATYRNTVLNRLKTVAMAHPTKVGVDDIANLSAIISVGRGEVVPPEYFPVHMALRSLVLVILRSMVDKAKERPELFYDILPSYSLFILYVNITENERVYDTAFPAISVAGANNIYHTKILSTLKQMAMMYTKVGFVGKAFNGLLSTRLLKEYFKIFEDLTDTSVYMEPNYDEKGQPIIDFTVKSFAQQNTVKFDAAVATFDEVIPSMFKGYTEEVINELKTAAGVDILLTVIADDIKSLDNMPAFPDLSTISRAMKLQLEDPEGTDAFPAHIVREISVKEFQKFVLSLVFPLTEGVYQLSVQVRQAYDRVLSSIGTPTGGLVPGVNVELESMVNNSISKVPNLASFNEVPYTKLDESYSFPFYLPPLAITKDKRQVWSLSHLKYKPTRPERVFSEFAWTGTIFGLDKAPNDPKISNAPVLPSAFNKWSWLPSSLPIPSYMHDIGFASTPIPFNYTFDTVFDFISNKGIKIDNVMTRTKKIPALGYLTYGETISSYFMNGAVNHKDMALALAGLGFLYVRKTVKSGKSTGVKWEIVSPGCPTIYGIPSIIMMDVNHVDIGSLLKDTTDSIQFKDLSDPTAERCIYDRKMRRIEDGAVIFVLHKKVPTPRPLKYFMANLRNGFNVKVPYYSSIFSALMQRSVNAIKKSFETEKPIGGIKLPTSDTSVPYYDIFQIFTKTLTIFLTAPEVGREVEGSGNSSAEAFYKAYMSGLSEKDITYQAFVEENFEDVLGWSNVLTAYPHLTMSDRYDELHQTHLKDIFRPLVSRVYVDSAQMRTKETLRILAIAPNDIEQMDANDEFAFYEKDMLRLSEIVGTTTPPKADPMRKENVGVEGELQQLATSVTIRQSKGEGSELVKGPENKITGEIPGTNVNQTIPPVIDMDKSKDEDPMITGLTAVRKDSNPKDQYPDSISSMKKDNIQTPIQSDKSELNVQDESLGKGVDLDNPKKTKENVGEGEATSGLESDEEEKKKKKAKGKKFEADNSEDETDV